MYDLALAHLTAAERERDLDVDLGPRGLLTASVSFRGAVTADLANTADAARALRPYPATGRARTAGR